MTAESPSTTDATEFCALSKREDGKHTWNFDGDDPYVICAFCDRMQDAINGRVIRPGRAPEFREPAGDLNTAQDVQESPAPSTTDRLAEIAARLANASDSPAPWYSHFEIAGVEITEPVHEILDAEGGRVCVTDTGSFLAELLEHAPADFAHLLAENARLQERLDTAEGRLAHFAAQHQPHDNLFKTCRTCKDGYGEPLPWPCADAKALGLDGGGSDAE